MLHNRDFKRGLDLFNRAHFFDSHEALEDIWRSVPSDNPLRRHLQGMVQLAVAFHHQSTGNYVGARSVLERALRNLHSAEKSIPFIDFELLREELTAWRQFLDDPNIFAVTSKGRRPKAPPLPTIVRRS